MRLLSLFGILVIVLVIMWFFINNMDQVVQEFEIFKYVFYNVNLVNILFGTLAVGILVGYLVPVFQYLGAKAEVRRLKKEKKKLQSELNDLRNLPVESGIEETEIVERTEETQDSDNDKPEIETEEESPAA